MDLPRDWLTVGPGHWPVEHDPAVLRRYGAWLERRGDTGWVRGRPVGITLWGRNDPVRPRVDAGLAALGAETLELFRGRGGRATPRGMAVVSSATVDEQGGVPGEATLTGAWVALGGLAFAAATLVEWARIAGLPRTVVLARPEAVAAVLPTLGEEASRRIRAVPGPADDDGAVPVAELPAALAKVRVPKLPIWLIPAALPA